MDIYDIWLCNCRLSSSIKLQLIKKFKTCKKVWYYCIDENKLPFNNITKKLKQAWDEEKLKTIEEKIFNNNIKTVNYFDDEYPLNLKKYEDCPFMLFYKGDIKKLNSRVNVSVVGARNCTFYGIQATEYIVENLSQNNINIISGMAKGIDKYAHSTCINKDGFTCAVLGCGIDVIYPKENTQLYYSIIEKGCIISEFLPGTKPYSYNFPIRNRIISGLGDLLLVIEAGEKSGTLITANHALEQGKDIVAVPGSIFSPQSSGTNKLISEGAYPYTDISGVLNLLGDSICSDYKIKKIENNPCLHKGIHAKVSSLINDNPIHIDDIMKRCNVDISQLYDVLFEMQFNNEIMCLSGNYYVKIHNI